MLILKRVFQNHNFTKGILFFNNDIICHTLELPYKENKRNISCIPEGKYELRKYSSSKYPNTLKLKRVPNRTNILIHPGNVVKHTQGCILVGKLTERMHVISNSRVTLNKVLTLFKDYNFNTIVVN